MVLEKANHPNIIKMVDRMKSKNHYYLVLEYCNGGDLASYIELVKKVSEEEGRLIIKQIVEGMAHLYKIKAIHRDIKLANIFLHFPSFEVREGELTKDELKSLKLTEVDFLIKIGDLGFSKI